MWSRSSAVEEVDEVSSLLDADADAYAYARGRKYARALDKPLVKLDSSL